MTLMSTKKVYIGSEAFIYTSQILWEPEKYAISINNQNQNRLNFYFFNENEDWLMGDEDPYSPFVITCYKLSENNEVKDIETLEITIDDNNKYKCISQAKTDQPTILNVEQIEVEVNQHVPDPNTLTLQFVEKNSLTPNNTNYYILLLTETATGIQYLELLQTTTTTGSSRVLLKSRHSYQYQLYRVQPHARKLTVIGHTGIKLIVTHNTQADVRDLQTLAEKHLNRIKSSIAIVHHLYRNKPIDHPTIIKAHETGVMEKYLKDNNGDPALSINNKIHGLFFLANAKTTSGEIPEDSSFGNYRIMVPPHYLVEGCHLYFADFTCVHGKSHYVTLVLTKIDSPEDRYCRDRLVKLDFSNNPFFYKYCGRFLVCHGLNLKVEILYTENVILRKLRKSKQDGGLDFREYILEDHLVTWEGHSTPGGIPKPSDCTYCNLLPIRS